jgi:hypothetical protein
MVVVSQMMNSLFEGGPGPLIVVVIFLPSWNCRDLSDKEHRGTLLVTIKSFPQLPAANATDSGPEVETSQNRSYHHR